MRRPEAAAFAVHGEKFVAVGGEEEVMRHRGDRTRVVDAGGRRVIPGLNDSHIHAVRSGRFYNLELRWDGVESLERALQMIREQAGRTPKGQWVRVIGAWSPHQFVEKRMPTVAELNAAAPTPRCSSSSSTARACSTGRAWRPSGSRPGADRRRADGTSSSTRGGCHPDAEPSPAILYTTIARLPQLSPEVQVNSTRHFFRELNRFGLTSVVDPGRRWPRLPLGLQGDGGSQEKPDFPLRLRNTCSRRRGGRSRRITRLDSPGETQPQQGDRPSRRLRARGAGETSSGRREISRISWRAAAELAARMEQSCGALTRLLARHQWPIRIHATYDQSISRVLDVFEPVFSETGYKSRWCIDHAETISPANIARTQGDGRRSRGAEPDGVRGRGLRRALRRGGRRVGTAAGRLLDAGIPIGGARCHPSQQPQPVALALLDGGRQDVGGTQLASAENRLTREEALRLYTIGIAWFSGEEGVKGRIAPGQYADFAVLSEDYFAVAEGRIRSVESVLTVVGGDVVYTVPPFHPYAPAPLPPVVPPGHRWQPSVVISDHSRGKGEPSIRQTPGAASGDAGWRHDERPITDRVRRRASHHCKRKHHETVSPVTAGGPHPPPCEFSHRPEGRRPGHQGAIL